MVSAAQRVTARSYSSLFVLVSYQLMNDLIETKYQHAEWRISIYGKAEVVIHPGQTLAYLRRTSLMLCTWNERLASLLLA